MSWSAITAAEVLEEFNPKEQAKIAQLQNAADNLTPILARVVNAARANIIAGGGQVDAAGTIPDQLREEVISIARWRWLLSIPEVNEALLSKSRKSDYDDAKKTMAAVSRGEIKVELPATPLAQQAPTNAVQVASADTRRATREKMEGL